tara:strand:+ start:116395 stop:116703 length:309 start_codon:yes stop_codon:yes gene_type:complete
MLGIVFIYFLGRSYFRLADEHNRSKWLWGVLGVVFFYALQVLLGLIIGLTAYRWSMYNEVALNFIGIGFGLLGSIGIYHLLKYNWSKNKIVNTDSEILDDLE